MHQCRSSITHTNLWKMQLKLWLWTEKKANNNSIDRPKMGQPIRFQLSLLISLQYFISWMGVAFFLTIFFFNSFVFVNEYVSLFRNSIFFDWHWSLIRLKILIDIEDWNESAVYMKLRLTCSVLFSSSVKWSVFAPYSYDLIRQRN